MNTSNITSSNNKLGEITSIEQFTLVGIDIGLWKIDSNNVINNRYDHSACGVVNNCSIHGGTTKSSTYLNTTESYDGNNWKIANSLNTSRRAHSACGVNNNCIITGGANYIKTSEYFNGSSWNTLSAQLNMGRHELTQTGIYNNCMIQGGYYSRDEPSTEIYNGNVWTTSVPMNIGKSQHTAIGNAVNCMTQGTKVFSDSNSNKIEFFNNSVWSIGISLLNIGRAAHSATGILINNCMVQGGEGSSILSTEIYNGDIWIISSNLNIKRQNHSASNSVIGGMVQAGTNGSIIYSTESYI